MKRSYFLLLFLVFLPVLFAYFQKQNVQEEAVFTTHDKPQQDIKASLQTKKLNQDIPVLDQQEQIGPEQAEQEQIEQTQTETVEYKIKSGDTLTAIFAHFKQDSAHLYKLVSALKEQKINLNQFVRTNSVLNIAVNQQNQLLERITSELSLTKTLVIDYINEEDSFKVNINEIPSEKKTFRFAAKIVNSIASASTAGGVPYNIIDDLVDIFGHKINFTRDLHKGDSFAIQYDDLVTEEGLSLNAGTIHSAAIVSRGKKYIAIAVVDADHKRHYIDENKEVMGSYFLRYPVKFSRISSNFTNRRFHPVLNRYKAHNGVDFAAPVGTPIRASADGIIQTATYGRANGNWVKIKHSSKYSTAYLHMHKISKQIKKGYKVSRGEVIGTVGTTGLSSGPHLHYSFYVNGKYVDPMKVKLPTINLGKAKISQAKFDSERKSLDELIAKL